MKMIKLKNQAINISDINKAFVKISTYALLVAILAGCTIFDPQANKRPLQGNRIDVFGTEAIEEAKVDQKTAQRFYATKYTYPRQINSVISPNSGNLAFSWKNVKAKRTFASFSGKVMNSTTLPIINEKQFIILQQNGVLSSYNAVDKTSWDNKFFLEKHPEFWGRQYKNGAVLLDSEVVFATAGSEYVAAFCAKTGKLIWHKELSKPLRGGLNVVGSNLVVTTLDSAVYVLNKKTGQLAWSSVVARRDGHSIQTISAPRFSVLNIANKSSTKQPGIAILQDHYGYITYFKIHDDKYDVIGSITPEIYAISPNVGNMMPQHSNVMTSNNIMVATFDNGTLIGADQKTQKILWRYNYGINKEIWASDDLVYAINYKSQLMAINSADGKIIWVRNLNEAIQNKLLDKNADGSAKQGNANVKIAKQDNNRAVSQLASKSADGEKIQDKSNQQQWTSPILAGNNVVTINNSGDLVAFDMLFGDLKYMMKVGRPQMLAPLALNGKMYILAVDGSMQELK